MKRYVAGFILGLILVSYQNCGLAPQHMVMSASSVDPIVFSKTCDGILQRAYYQSYYPVFRTTCTGCHDNGGESGRYFASHDFQQAYGWFESIGRRTIETKAQDDGHKPPRTGAHMTPVISDAQSLWTQADQQFANCQNNTGTTTQVASTFKTNPMIFTTTPANNVAWPRVTWNLETDVNQVSLLGTLKMEVSVEVRRYMVGTPAVAMGYEFRNPRVRVLDDGNTSTALPAYQLEGLYIAVNGTRLSNFTLFGSLNFTASSGTETLMMPGVGFAYALADVDSSDEFGLIFERIEDSAGAPITGGGGGSGGGSTTLPARVSYADLASSNQLLGVFSQSCFSCHSGATARAGLNLTDFNQARAVASQIQARMNNPNSPMPPTGILSATKRSIVDIWISSGTPQN
jgi:hypothetical protein